MRIISIYRHYWPDVTPYARILRGLLEAFEEEGHDVSVFTAQPSYNGVKSTKQPGKELLEGVEVNRITLLSEKKNQFFRRATNSIYFLVRAFLFVFFRRTQCDLIISNVHPPVFMGCLLRLIRFTTGIPYILHCQDIHPEAAFHAGFFKSKILQRILVAIDHRNCDRAERVVVLSGDMAETLQSRYPNKVLQNIEVINNFSLQRYASNGKPLPLFENKPEQSPPFRILFSGNIGRFQCLHRLLEVSHLLKSEKDIYFIFMGAGSEKNKLKLQAGELLGKTVFFEDHQSVETAFACMELADLGVVSLAPHMFSLAFPSKTMTYLSAGCPLLTLVESQSELSQVVTSNKLGIVPENLTAHSISETVKAGYKLRDTKYFFDKKRIRDCGEKVFGREKVINLWCALLMRIQSQKTIPVQKLRLKKILPTRLKQNDYKNVEEKVVA